MVFSSFLFLFLFLPVVLGGYFLLVGTKRSVSLLNYFLTLVSILFYGWGAPQIVPLLILSSGMDYLIAKKFLLSHYSKRRRLLGCQIAVGLNISFLLYYKYANFFISETNSLLVSFGVSPIGWVEIALPIGISFFTFHKISYVVDLYRGIAGQAKSFANYLLYVTFFPQLVAGPIIRYHDIADQIEARTHSLTDFHQGMMRFLIGLARKVLIADPLGAVADNVFNLPQEQLTFSFAWLGILAYTFQIYFDFSGYSDMAIGLARMFGIKFRENFNFPYVSQNITEFWRRWHISLSTWMREYLYIPLGGNRVSNFRMYANLWIVFLLSGLWHGASWNFLIWGAYHGAFLVFDKLFWIKRSARLPVAINIFLTFFVVTIGWIPFRAETLEQSIYFIKALFGFGSPFAELMPGDIIHARGYFILLVAAVLSIRPCLVSKFKLLQALNFQNPALAVTQGLLVLSLFILSIAALASAGYVPFLYFKF